MSGGYLRVCFCTKVTVVLISSFEILKYSGEKTDVDLSKGSLAGVN